MAKSQTAQISGASHRNMGQWRSKKIQKAGKGSQATGRSKGIVASALQKTMCRRNRSYKNPVYGMVMASLGARKQK
jgi:hypothetical protein